MTKRGRRIMLAGSCVTAILILAAAMPAQAPQTQKTTEQVFKNIQVLKGIPADELIPSMQFITAALGVECDFCHVQGAFDKDDKKPKLIARKMMTMMFAIDRDNFEGHHVVTCNSCHRGSPHPVGIPAIAGVEPAVDVAAMHEMHAEGGEDAKAPAGPAADPLIEKYIQALGGAAAIEKVSTRIEKGSAEVMGEKLPIDVYTKAPDKRLSVLHLPKGDSITAYNGSGGWLGFPGRPIHDMSASEAAAASLDADLHFATDMKKIFTGFKPAAPAKIGERDTYVLVAMRESQPPVKLYFDQKSGLLVRMLRFSDTPLGLNPTEIDYADYREVNGVKTPFRWTLARPSGAFTIQIDQVEQNVPIDDAKFARPPNPPRPEKTDGK
jgi:photosynthetic reaction center cytochrome c subunit